MIIQTKLSKWVEYKMPQYFAPVKDQLFVLSDYLAIDKREDLDGFSDLTPDFLQELLSTAAKFREKILHPINLAGDLQGAKLVDGQVITPDGYKEAWKAYSEAGWNSLSLPEEIGGQGLPSIIEVAISEMDAASCHAFKMYNAFCLPSSFMLNKLGAEWMREFVVPKLVNCEWAATMAMTESHCGTDLKQLRTKAIKQEDGTYRLSGNKIFISGGGQDLSDNIIHIVLAKIPEEDGSVPMKLSSVNVFLVSNRKIDINTGEIGENNGVKVLSIEKKMGIAASATCVLEFEDSIAYRIAGSVKMGSAANMAAMFILMNFARFGTSFSGVATAELAYQNAAQYAKERRSGRALTGPQEPDKIADILLVHPDIRRLLLTSRSFAEGARALGLKMSLCQSIAAQSKDEIEKQNCEDLVELMTPVMKAFFTDRGFQAAVDCQQVLGGHGYIADYGLEQMVKNARIGQIYEGANGIQALDLITRKLGANKGRAGQAFIAQINATIETAKSLSINQKFIDAITKANEDLNASLEFIAREARSNPNLIGSAAYDLLTQFGLVAIGWTWLEILVLIAQNRVTILNDTEIANKQTLAAIWLERELPMVGALRARIEAGADCLMAIDNEDF